MKSLTNVVTYKDANGYHEESWRFSDYDKMQDHYDELMADGIILDWWISN